jgi:transcription elongation factor Elf1
MEEIEKYFRCPHCHEKISMILDLSVPDFQTYIEDCEVCCSPIQISFTVENDTIKSFSAVGV